MLDANPRAADAAARGRIVRGKCLACKAIDLRVVDLCLSERKAHRRYPGKRIVAFGVHANVRIVRRRFSLASPHGVLSTCGFSRALRILLKVRLLALT